MVDSSKLQPVFYDFVKNEYVSKRVTEDGLCAFQFVEEGSSSRWFIEHGRNFKTFKINVFSSDGFLVYPEKITVVDENDIVLDFLEPVEGVANVIYYTKDSIGCTPDQLIEEVILLGINTAPTNNSDINGVSPII